MSLVGDAMLRPLIDALSGPMKGTDCSSLFSVSSSGAIMSETVRRQFQELVPNVMLLNNFGSSESGFNGTATADSGPGAGLPHPRQLPYPGGRSGDVRAGRRGRGRAGSPSAATYRSATTTTRRRPPRPSSRRTASGGCCSATWRRSTRRASSPSSAAARSASTPAARRCIRRRSSRPSSPIRTCTTRWWPGCRTRSGATTWRRSYSCATGAARPSLDDDPVLLPYAPRRATRSRAQLVVTDAIQRSPSGKADYRWAREVAVAADIAPARAPGGAGPA